LAIAAVTVFFGAVEFVLASFGVRPVLLTEDPLVGFAENVPQFVEATRPDGTAILRTARNKRGLFNYQEFPREKDPDSYRIFCMGGSTTYGRPYGDRVSFCGWLRVYLQAADPARNWEVINAGGISFASYRVARLMDELSHYQPDLFIVYSGQNEFLEQRSYGALLSLPPWVLNLNATLSGTRTYTAMKSVIDAMQPDSLKQAQQRNKLSGEVDEILNHTVGPKSYRRDDVLKQQIITHFDLNMRRMVKIAHSVDSDIVFVRPAINVKDMSPFKSEHAEGLDAAALGEWEDLYRQATELQAAGDYNEALAVYRQALVIDDRYAELHYRTGQVLFSLGRYDAADQAFRRAVEEDIAPLRILASMQQVIATVAAEEDVPLIDFPAIIRTAYLSEYDHAVFGKEYFPDHVHTNMEGYRLLGLALFDELVGQGIATADASWNAARIEAIGEQLIAGLDPRSEGHTMINLGKVLDWAGKFEEAYNTFQRALEILGPHPVVYERLARSSYVLGKPDEALHYLRETLVLAPTMRGVHARLGMILGKQGKTDEAIEHCLAELELKPDDHYVRSGLAQLYERKGDTDAALAEYRAALQIRPEHVFARIKLADLLIRLDRDTEALEHIEAVLRTDPDQHRAHNALGLIRKKQGKYEQAKRHFSEALQLQPDYEAARDNLQRLQAEQAGMAGSGGLT
jgi:tetratricopeptide (TPR) repeat protein